MDRLAAAAGAWRVHRGPVLVVDAGTALTVDLVDADGVFQGGAILPGLEISNRSLEAGAAALKAADLRADPPVWPARTTDEAIRTGVLTQAAAAVEAFHERARFLAGADPGLWVTGGDADLLLPHLGGDVHCDPLLVHRGLLAAEG
jgi:type III pantothenate kinase